MIVDNTNEHFFLIAIVVFVPRFNLFINLKRIKLK